MDYEDWMDYTCGIDRRKLCVRFRRRNSAVIDTVPINDSCCPVPLTPNIPQSTHPLAVDVDEAPRGRE